MGPIEIQIVEWLKALTPLVIGIAVAIIALRQWITADRKFKLDLYDRRFKVYDAMLLFLDNMPNNSKDVDPHLAAFRSSAEQITFLFSPDVKEIFYELLASTFTKQMTAEQMRVDRENEITDSVTVMRYEQLLAKKEKEISELQDRLLEAVRPYLNFSTTHGPTVPIFRQPTIESMWNAFNDNRPSI